MLVASEAPARIAPAPIRTVSAPTEPSSRQRGCGGSNRIRRRQGARARAPPSPPATSASRNPASTACRSDGVARDDLLARASAPARAANVFVASDRARLPAIRVPTPYGKGVDITPNYQAFVEHGYAIVVEDVRGRYESEGAFQPLTQEVHDGDDTLNWIARQPWSDGKIGMMGGSYLGIAQWKAALANNPHLKAIFPVVSGYDDYRDRSAERR